MGKAARNRRSRNQQAQAAAERLKRRGSTGPLRADSAEAREVFARAEAEADMPCRATFLDDPLFGGRQAATVTGMTPAGDLMTEPGEEADRIPVLLFEPVHTIALQDGITGLWREGRTEGLIAAGWQRVRPRFVMAGVPADVRGHYSTAAGVELLDPYMTARRRPKTCTFSSGSSASARFTSPGRTSAGRRSCA